MLSKYISHAPPGLLPRSPEVRRREVGRDFVLAHHVKHGLGRLAHYESLCALTKVPSLIYLAYGVSHVVLVHHDEICRQHVEAVVDCHVAPPPGRRLEGRHDMHVPVPLAEILACEHVPGAVEPGLSQLIWQGLEHVYVLGVLFHQHGVVRDLGLDKLVVVRALVASILSVNKEPFHPGMANSAGVAGEVHALGEVVCAAQAALEGLELEFRELSSLVDKDDVELLALVLEHVPLRRAVAEADVRAVREDKALLLLLPPGYVPQLHLQREYVVVAQLLKAPAHDEYLDACVSRSQQHCLHAYGPGLAAAARPAVAYKAPAGLEEQLLPLVEPQDFSLHSRPPPRLWPRGTHSSRCCRQLSRPPPCSASAQARGL